ncbi:MAG: dTDP-4-dehydrorhamnose reductase [Betaproteobacteria bacterium]|nr:dTDP-4-dehydrorhamnose reductase [Betaproteobacteria bacterium]
MAEAQVLRIVLLGAQGQLGHALAQALPALGAVKAFGRAQADLTQPEALRQLLDAHQPQLIVNAAAYTAVDKAQTEPALALAINAQAPAVLAQWAASQGAVLVHYSTDYVFDGHATRPYMEADAPAPASVYGQSKWAGERAVQAAGGRHLVFRTSWVVGAHGGNFLKTMLRLAMERDTLRVVADQHGAPTAADLIAQTTVQVLQQMRDPASDANSRSTAAGPWTTADDPRWGLYHLAASGDTTWHAYACHVLARAQARGWPLRASAERILAITTDEYPLPAPRPANSRLDTRRLQSRFGLAMPDWRAGVDAVLDSLQPPKPA